MKEKERIETKKNESIQRFILSLRVVLLAVTFEVSLFPTLPFLFELIVARMSLLWHDADHSDSVDADEGNSSCCLPRPLLMLFLLLLLLS